MKNDHRLSFVMKGAMILSLAALISKVLSAVYRVPFQNLVGNRGLYVFQQVYPIYGIGMVLALSGLPVMISRLIAEEKDVFRQQVLLRQIWLILLLLGLIIFVVLQLFASTLAGYMGDLRLDSLIHAISWMFLLMPTLAALRGYFQAILQMKPTAYSQVAEQIIRVCVIVGAAILGSRNGFNVYVIGTYAMFATPIAEIFSVAILWWYYCHYGHPLHMKLKHRVISYCSLLKLLCFEGGTICLFASLMVMMQLIDSFSVIKGLIGHGWSLLEAQNGKGIYDRGQPLVQLGLVIATSFVSAMLPSLSAAFKNHQFTTFRNLGSEMMRVSIFMTVGLTTGMISLMPLINQLLFNSHEENLALSVFMLNIILTTLIMVYSSILQSANYFRLTILSIIVGLLSKLILTKWLVIQIGVLGASMSTVISLLLMLLIECFLAPSDIVAIKNATRFILVLCGLGLVLFIIEKVFYQLLTNYSLLHNPRLNALLDLAVLVPLGISIFLLLAYKCKLLDENEWQSVPFVHKVFKKVQK
jgi:polysaccharide transporter, PST family